LVSSPVLHNLILTLLEARISRPDAGRYWVAHDGRGVVGVALQSPLTVDANLTPMATEVVDAMVEAISGVGPAVPGVLGEVVTCARFAGGWTERGKCGAVPYQGIRIYEVDEATSPGRNGRLRRAIACDRRLLMDWMRAFLAESGDRHSDPEPIVDTRLRNSQFWLWEADEPLSLASVSVPVAGVVRVQATYTPPPWRNRGYAKACVGSVSRQFRADGLRCILFTDLANAVSNRAFRSIGYRCVAEAIRYRFVYEDPGSTE
jgi:GNAT superfamily N-acetyltransferase